MYIIICEIDHQSRFDVWDRMLRAGALGWPRGMGWGGRWEGDSGWGTHVHPWLIHVTVRQKPPQYCKVISLQLKFKKIIEGPRAHRNCDFQNHSLYTMSWQVIGLFYTIISQMATVICWEKFIPLCFLTDHSTQPIPSISGMSETGAAHR